MNANWWESIRELAIKIKAASHRVLVGDVAVVLIVVLVAMSAFGLGRLSAYEDARPLITQERAQQSDERAMYLGGDYVASRRGSKYHFPWCPGARTMNAENKIWFDSIEDARAAGYEPAGNCKGIE